MNLRGQTGVMPQLCITFGIVISQSLGFRQLLGNDSLWNFLISGPLFISLIGSMIVLLVVPDSPHELLFKRKDEQKARQVLKKLRSDCGNDQINDEMRELIKTQQEATSDKNLTLMQLLTSSELKWVIIVVIAIQFAQQFSGVNAVSSFFKSFFFF